MTDQQPIDQDAVKLAACPFCGSAIEPVGAFSSQCRGVVGGKDIHNTIVMNNAAWNRRASPPVREGEAVDQMLNCARDFASRIAAHPPQGEAEMRSRLARIVHPEAFEPVPNTIHTRGLQKEAQFVAFAKADAILALTGRGKGDE